MLVTSLHLTHATNLFVCAFVCLCCHACCMLDELTRFSRILNVTLMRTIMSMNFHRC